MNTENIKAFAEKHSEFLKDVGQSFIVIVTAVIFAVILGKYVFLNANIPSASMENTIMTGDKLIANRLYYNKHDPARGDIVIFNAPDTGEEYIKRVIGLPGEKVEIKDCKLYVDGKCLKEPYLKDEKWTNNNGPYTFNVPKGSYLLLGDNRNNSFDAREWKHTYVKRDAIKAKAGLRYYPFDRFGVVQ